MEFDTGSQVEPGEDITLETANGSIDLGAATYDADADGVADSVIVVQDDLQFVITDANHDGHAESLHAFDFQGQEVDPKTGAPVAAAPDTGDASGAVGIGLTGGDGADHFVGTPTIDPDGMLVPDTRPAAPTVDPAAAGDVNAPATSWDGNSTRAEGISVTDRGQAYDLGRPTTDLDGDGALDTVVTHLADGTVVCYSDTDGDGRADQVTRISPDGAVVIGVADGSGGWEQAGAGQVDLDGRFVPQA